MATFLSLTTCFDSIDQLWTGGGPTLNLAKRRIVAAVVVAVAAVTVAAG